ncbi:MAG: hypothetical protein ACE5NG_09060 [bacterium]
MMRFILLLIFVSNVVGCMGSSERSRVANEYSGTLQEVIYYRGEFELKGYLCKPEGTGPFPAVIYNHGGLGNRIGGAPIETCQALPEPALWASPRCAEKPDL